MEAKYTVMSDQEMMDLDRGEPRACADHAIANRQAEISFKAGTEVGYTDGYTEGRGYGKKAGIKEVVKWIEENAPHYKCSECGYEQHLDDDWQAFKESRGV